MTSLLHFPPPAFSELAWDVLLALHGHRRGQLDLDRLSCLASAPPSAVSSALATLESLQFVIVRPTGPSGQRRPLLTLYGCDLLERYFSAASGLQSAKIPHRQRAAQS